jgi:ABC-type glycerol-3-phosphate transport system permease component
MGDNKNQSAFVFVAMLFVATPFELGSIIPFIGNLFAPLFLFFARLGYWLAGYRSKGTTALTVGTVLVEMIPGFSILPGCYAFVTGFYLTNKASGIISKTTTKNKKGVLVA